MDDKFTLLSDDIIMDMTEVKRSMCEKCNRPDRVCWCAYLPQVPININGRVIILQHPDEEKRNLKTGPMLFHGLAPGKCLIFYGHKFPLPKHKGLREILLEPNTFVLYPGRKAHNLLNVKQSLNTIKNDYNLILIDGTWKQAKSMFFHSTALHDMPQISLPDMGRSLYVIRTQPSEKCLSTLESAALAISIMEEDESILEQLVQPLKALCTFQIKHGAVEHQDKVTLLELGQYQKPVGKRTVKFLRRTVPEMLNEDSKLLPVISSLRLKAKESVESGDACRVLK